MAHSTTRCLFILLCTPHKCGLLAEECGQDGVPGGVGVPAQQMTSNNHVRQVGSRDQPGQGWSNIPTPA